MHGLGPLQSLSPQTESVILTADNTVPVSDIIALIDLVQGERSLETGRAERFDSVVVAPRLAP